MAERGRPSKYTEEIANEICSRLSEGEPLAQICRDEHMPGLSTVYEWRDQPDKKEFSGNIVRAREAGFDHIAQDALRIADTPLEGVEVTTDSDGKVTEKRSDMLGHRKMQIETRLKLLAKWDPKRYGEKLDLNHSGEIATRSLSDEQLETRLAELLRKAGNCWKRWRRRRGVTPGGCCSPCIPSKVRCGEVSTVSTWSSSSLAPSIANGQPLRPIVWAKHGASAPTRRPCISLAAILHGGSARDLIAL